MSEIKTKRNEKLYLFLQGNKFISLLICLLLFSCYYEVETNIKSNDDKPRGDDEKVKNKKLFIVMMPKVLGGTRRDIPGTYFLRQL